MGINQAIFTSSARGIQKGGGLGLHTFNRKCSEEELREFEQGFCQYSYRGDSGEISNLPRKMFYRKTDCGRYIQSSVTYLGQDYAKGQGRTGNLLSHMYSFEKKDITVYPIQLYGSPDFRYAMNQEEVDGSRDVEYLPEISSVRTGTEITVSSVQEFLEEEPWRMDFFRHLLAAVFQIDTEHKVIIYDDHRNIIRWIAAVSFALPLQCAAELSFSSYEENPMLSEFSIRGAVPGLSIGNCVEYESGGQFYVFDGTTVEYPEFDLSEDYFQYGIGFGIDVLEGFHAFLKNYAYNGVHAELCDGYNLYQMMQDGMEILGEKEFKQAVSFESKYGDKGTYRTILENQFEKLENYRSDESVLKSIYIWLSGYMKKELDVSDWDFAVSCMVRLEPFGRGSSEITNQKEQIWGFVFDAIIQKKKEAFYVLVSRIKKAKMYEKLGEISRYLILKQKAMSIVKFLEEIFQKLWESEPQTEYRCFDSAAGAVADMIMGKGETERYETAMQAFLKLQEIGNREIHGAGMEKLIGMISEGTKLSALRAQKSGLLHRRKEENRDLEKIQAKCAFEVFNYTQKYNPNLSIAKIRLFHLSRCIQTAMEEGKPLAKAKSMQIYEDYPVEMGETDAAEFQDLVEILCESIYTVEAEAEDYIQLLTCWILEEEQKKILLEIFLSYEMSYMKKENQVRGLASLLLAVRTLNDAEYLEALRSVVLELKESQREKAAAMMKKNWGQESKSYQFWMALTKKEEKPLRNPRKKFGKFGKH